MGTATVEVPPAPAVAPRPATRLPLAAPRPVPIALPELQDRRWKWLADGERALRRLPPLWVRRLMAIDFFLCLLVPGWAYFWFVRWTGRLLSPSEFFALARQGASFAWAHIKHTGEGTGCLNVDWLSPPVRRCEGAKERADHFPRGSCGDCKKCCTTSWLPEGENVTCPFLGEAGCTIYGGIYWDYFNCGRYPSTPAAVEHYSCPRFEGLFARPVTMPSGK